MKIIRLQPPRPKQRVVQLREFDFGITGLLPIPAIKCKKLPELDVVLKNRQSRREFKSPLTLQQLGDLLWHSSHVRRKNKLHNGTFWESRPAPSGGGCHPIQILVLRAPVLKQHLLIYDANHHAFGVRNLKSDLYQRCIAEVEQCLKIQKGTVLWFVADLARSQIRYDNPESLAWRDSGTLLATICLIAEGLRLNCCGLGIHEIASLRRLLKFNQEVFGVGGCIIGCS